MLPKLNSLYQCIEDRKTRMLTYLESLPDTERNKNPTASEWSPLQVMEHVVVVEEWMAGPNAAILPSNARVLMKGHLFILNRLIPAKTNEQSELKGNKP